MSRLVDDGFLPDAHQSPPTRRGCSVLPFLVILFLASLVGARPESSEVLQAPVTTGGGSSAASLLPGASDGPLATARATELLAGSSSVSESSTLSPGAPLPRLAAALPSAGTPASVPATEHGEVGTVIVGGWATWFEASGYQAAVPWWEAGQDPVTARVCSGHCILVKLTGYCACGDRHGIPTVADLSPAAFREFAPLAQGLVKVTVEWPVELPQTDKEGE